jgi:hypothetical protein
MPFALAAEERRSSNTVTDNSVSMRNFPTPRSEECRLTGHRGHAQSMQGFALTDNAVNPAEQSPALAKVRADPVASDRFAAAARRMGRSAAIGSAVVELLAQVDLATTCHARPSGTLGSAT